MVEFSEVAVGAAGGGFVVAANGAAPIFEEFAILEADVERIGLESGSSDGVIPGGEELRELVLGDS